MPRLTEQEQQENLAVKVVDILLRLPWEERNNSRRDAEAQREKYKRKSKRPGQNGR